MRTLVVAPHADDEVLGCGGSLLRWSEEGSDLGWMLITCISPEPGNQAIIDRRKKEINIVRQSFNIRKKNLFELGIPTTTLDQVPVGNIIEKISAAFHSFQPEQVLLPHAHDIHSDHRVVFDAVIACTKWFRYSFVKRILSYETLSETDCILLQENIFKPNVFIDISEYLDKKIKILKIYKSEIGEFPFPRSEIAVRSLAHTRGAQSGFLAAEAFHLLRERC